MSNRKRKDILEIASNFEGNLIDYVEKLTKERDLYKSVLNEVREYIKEKELKDIKGNTLYCEENLIWHELALILAKVGDE